MFHSLVTFLLTNGIGQNVTAGALMGIPAFIWGKRELVKLHARHNRHHAAVMSQLIGVEYDPETGMPKI